MEEIKDVEKNLPLSCISGVWFVTLPLSCISGVWFVTLCYVFVNLAFSTTLSKHEICQSATIGLTFVEQSLGKHASYVMSVLVSLSGYSAINSCLLSNSRFIMVAAREGHFPEVFSYIHKRLLSPAPAILLL